MMIINWIADNWGLVCAGAALLVALLNVVTRHYSESTGVGRLALLAIDLLSFLTSGAARPYVKLPLKPSTAPLCSDIRRRVHEIKKCREKQQPLPPS